MKKILLTLFCLANLITIKSQVSITVGSADSPNVNTDSSPINIYYKSHHCQILYTQAELITAGWNGAGTISKLGFNIFGTTSEGLPNFSIKLKNTSANDLGVYDNTGLTTVYTSALYQPTAGGFDMLSFGTNFLWDGTSNILIDICFDLVSEYTTTGQVYLFNYTSGNSEYQYIRDDSAPQCAVATSQNGVSSKPQIKFEMTSSTPCSGAPNSGIAISNKILVCPNTSFDLSLSNGSIENGINFQWQSSPDGSIWSNLGTSQTNWDYTVNSITDTTYYRCVSTCSNSALTNTSMPIVVNYNPLINCYCMPSYSWDCSGDKISDFSVANVVFQPSNCDFNGYSDSTSSAFTVINLAAGNTYSLQANIANSGNGGDMVAGAWIDYDQNGNFDGNEFIYLGFGGTQIYSNTFTVPVTAPTGEVRMRIKVDASSANISTSLSACDNNNFSAYGQILDYKVSITAAPACSGNPNAGNAISTETAVCQNKPFTLDLTNNSVASNITYQWQSSTDNITWTNLGVSQNVIPYSISSQSITTYYRCISTCAISALTGTSTPITVTQNAAITCYCVPQNISCILGGITNILFETLNDAPVCNAINGYTDNSTLTPIPLNANQNYTISIDVNAQSGTSYVGLWIDYNQDGIFDSNEYTHAGSTNIGNLTTTISIPFTAAGGTTRMRVKLESTWGYTPTLFPCTNSNSDGQVIDYNVVITAATPCTGAPNAGDATSSISSVCESIPFTLNLINNDIVSNMSYQWQSSLDNVSWTNLGSAQTNVPYLILSQSSTSYYRCLTTCTTSALTSTSTVWTINQNAVTDCYCIPPPADCSMGNEINNVNFSNLIINPSTCSTDAYGDYTSSVASATISAGQTYTLDVTIGSIYDNYISVWIDYNKNGVFETNEYTNLGSTYGNNTVNGSINIPFTALTGSTRMRIRNNLNMVFSPSEACANNYYSEGDKMLLPGLGSGETEDYLVTILPPDCSVINFPPTVVVSGTLDICPGSSTTLDLTNPLPVATGITYQWKSFNGTVYVNEGTASNSSSLSVSPTSSTLYFCEILCNGTVVRNTDTVLVKVQTITTSPIITNVTCNGLCNGSATVNASSFGTTLSYMWMPSGGTADAASLLCAGLYSVTITNVIGCIITETVSITEPIAITAAPSQTNISCYGLTDGVATVTVTGGTSPLNFSWLPSGGTALTASNLATGNYTFNILDGNGCSLSQTITITEPGMFSASINANNSSICEQLEDTISSTIVGGTAPYLYNWMELPSSTVSTNPNYEYVTSVGTHTYNLTVTDINGCVANSNTVSIVVNPSSNFSGVVTTNMSSPVPVAGRVVLYKYVPYYTQFDSVAGQNIGAAGDFLFNSFTAGIYIIKAIPTATNMQIAYGDSAVTWKDAVQINHGCAVNDVQDIFVKSLGTFTTTGIGSLSGTIFEDVGFEPRIGSGSKPTIPGTPIGGIIVKGGKNPGGQMFVQTVTSGDFGPGAKGTYTLEGLPPNEPGESYFIMVDIPGLDTNQTYHKIITITDNNFMGLDFYVDSARINPIPSSVISVNDISAIENEIKVFPNPASSNVSIQYNLKANALVKIELFDMLGKSIKMLLPETQQSVETHKMSWQIDDVRAGLYFIKMTINGIESTIKLSVTN